MTPRTLLAPGRLAGQPVLRSQADERLVDLALAGSTPAFEAIVTRYRGPLLGYCARILDEGRAEDAVQQTFMKAHAALGRGERVLKLRPWLYRIAHNTALNTLRDSMRAEEPWSAGVASGDGPEQVAELRQSFRDVLAAVKALPARQRDAIVLRELEGRSHEEIARELDVSSGAARQLLHRARISIRAGITAVTPLGSMARFAGPLADAPAARFAELCAAGSGSALAAKLCTGALVAGVVAGGVTGSEPAQREATPSSSSSGKVAAIAQPRDARSATVAGAPAETATAAAVVRRTAAGTAPAVRKQAAASPASGPATRVETRADDEPERAHRHAGGEPRAPAETRSGAPAQSGGGHSDPGAGGHEMRAEPGIAPAQPQGAGAPQDQATVIFP